ncbi:hypothetical protein [Mycobacterium sp. MMS18-G62]
MRTLAAHVGVRPIVGVAAAFLAMPLIGSGVAGATTSPPDVTGQKYSDAQTAISGAGFTPVVSTTVGDQNLWPNCLVTRTQQRTVQPPPNSSGSAVNEVLVSLNCDAGVASTTQAGNSAASPEGKAAAAAAASSSGGSSS